MAVGLNSPFLFKGGCWLWVQGTGCCDGGVGWWLWLGALGQRGKKKRKKKHTFVVLDSLSGVVGTHAIDDIVGCHCGWLGMVVVAAVTVQAWGGGHRT
jgi:hypothetical protein